MMAFASRRLVTIGLAVLLAAAGGWMYFNSLVPAIHPDHDHGLENIAGGGFLRVERVEGGVRNLVGRPGRVLILHWFEPGSPTTKSELPLLVDFARRSAADADVEVVLVAMGTNRSDARSWASTYGVPTEHLYVDRESKTAALIGVRRSPETMIYDAEGHLAHQARGTMDWSDPEVLALVASIKRGAGAHKH